MSVPARVSVVRLVVADVARSSAFYRLLGWPPCAASRDEIALFRTAGALLALCDAEAATAAGLTVHGGSSEGSRGVLLTIHTARREEVDDALQAAQAAGASMLEPAAHGPDGEYLGYFADPDGHLFQVLWDPRFVLGPHGHYVIS